MRIRRAEVLVLLASIAVGAAGCATLWSLGVRFPDGGRSCAGELVDARSLPDGLRLREQVRVRAEPDVSWGMTLVGEKQGDVLVVVALDGFGAKLFTIVQRGTDAEVERAFGRRMPWPPENVLRDLHRARLGADPGDGVTVDRISGEHGSGRVEIHHGPCRSDATFVGAEAQGSGSS